MRLAIGVVILMIFVSFTRLTSAREWYDPTEDGACQPSDYYLPSLEQISAQGNVMGQELLDDAIDVAGAFVEWSRTGATPPFPPINYYPDPDDVQFVTSPLNDFAQQLEYNLEPNHVLLVTEDLTVKATDTIWINGTILSLWDGVESPSIILSAPRIIVNGYVGTSSGLDAVELLGELGIMTAAEREIYYNIFNEHPEDTVSGMQITTGSTFGLHGLNGGDVTIIAEEFVMGEDACIATGDGGAGGSGIMPGNPGDGVSQDRQWLHTGGAKGNYKYIYNVTEC